jgi:hypothetical protein
MISEKLIQIAENEPKVYEAGKADGVEQGFEQGLAEVSHLNDELEQILYGTDTGGKSFYDEFWDNYQDYGNKKDYLYAFAGRGLSQEIYKDIKYGFGQPTSVQGMFRYNTLITDTMQPLDCTNAPNLSQTFDSANNLKRIRQLTVKPSHTYTSTFGGLNSLEELEIVGTIGNTVDLHWSTKLSKASIYSVLNALSTTTSGLPVTLSKTAVDVAFKTGTTNNGSTSNEWKNLIATKSNWTISLA